MVQDFENTQADYAQLYAYAFRKNLRWKIPLRLLIALGLALIVGFSLRAESNAVMSPTGIALFVAVGSLLFSLVLGVAGYFIGYGLFMRKAAKSGRKRVTIGPAGLYFESADTQQLYVWENVRSVTLNKGSVYLVIGRRKYIVIGAGNFVSKEHQDYFLAEIGKYRRS